MTNRTLQLHLEACRVKATACKLTSSNSMWSCGQRHAVYQSQLEPEHNRIEAASGSKGDVDGLRLTVGWWRH